MQNGAAILLVFAGLFVIFGSLTQNEFFLSLPRVKWSYQDIRKWATAYWCVFGIIMIGLGAFLYISS